MRPLAALGCALLLSLAGARPAAAPVGVRVLTYNIHHGEGRDGRLDLPRLADAIRAAEPDLVALQEVDRGTRRAGGVDQLAELARLVGMHAEFGKAMDYDGGVYGVAILSRWPVEDARTHLLPAWPGAEPRAALTVTVRLGGDGPRVSFTSTHLEQSRDSEAQITQARGLIDGLAETRGPAILAGDLNARPGSAALALVESVWTTALPDGALPAPVAADGSVGPDPGAGRRRGPRGDFVLFRPAHGWRVVESRSLEENTASDHRPVLTVLEWIEPAPPR